MSLKKAVLLFVVLALFVPSIAHAQEESEGYTEIQGYLPTEGGFGLIVWGGGTPYQLWARASIEGCSVARIFVFNEGRAISYSLGAPVFVNASFLAHYPDEIPTRTPLGIVCEERVSMDSYVGPQGQRCGQEWEAGIVERVLTRLPVMPHVCLWDLASTQAYRQVFGGNAPYASAIYVPSKRILLDRNANEVGTSFAQPEVRMWGVHHEASKPYIQVHELCHSNAEWYANLYGLMLDEWEETPQGKELFELVGWYRDADGVLRVSEGSPFVIYGTDRAVLPLEMAADLCAATLGFTSDSNGDGKIAEHVPENIREWAHRWFSPLP